MIDIEKAKKYFKEYVSNYDVEDEQIKLKIAHMERVSNISINLAKHLNLSDEDIKLAGLIGLLHDIGRFEQIKTYHTFVDRKSVNHGELGVKILFDNGIIRNFIEDKQYDNIIKKAILNHNRQEISDTSNERELIHSKIIRDSDKIDILYILTFDRTKTCYGIEDFTQQDFTDEIYEAVINQKKLDYSLMKNEADILIAHFAYIYDFNYKYGLKIVKDNNYLEKIYNRYVFKDSETMKKYNNIYNKANKFIENI